MRTKCLRLGLPKQSTLPITHDSYHTTTGTVPVSYLCQARNSQKQRGVYFASAFKYANFFFLPHILLFSVFGGFLPGTGARSNALPYRTSKVTPSSPSSPPSRPHNPTPKNSRSPRYNTCQRQKTLSSSANTYTLRYSTGTYIHITKVTLSRKSELPPFQLYMCSSTIP